MTKEVREMGRVIAKAQADPVEIPRHGEGQFEAHHVSAEEWDLACLDGHWIGPGPEPEPVWSKLLLAVAAGAVLGLAIGYGLQSFWLEGM